jgi:acetyltransferase-like isoleucine patch superfamily enzyme
MKTSAPKRIFLLLISLIPVNAVKIFLYRVLFGYDIDYTSRIGFFNILSAAKIKLRSSYIGHFNQVECDSLTLIDSRIKKFNRLIHLNKAFIEGVDIGTSNKFYGCSDQGHFKQYENITIGRGTTITNNHVFDINEEIVIGKDVTIGGFFCQFWTHGFDLRRTKKLAGITIGNNVYIASSCIILPGVSICDDVSLSSGTVVPKSIRESGFYYSSGLVRRDLKYFDYTPEDVHGNYVTIRQ